MPSPIGMTASVSPYMSKLTGHGKVDKINGAQLVHNGVTLSIRLSWHDPDKDDALNDLDQFTDGVAIMFPLVAGASALWMGSPGQARQRLVVDGRTRSSRLTCSRRAMRQASADRPAAAVSRGGQLPRKRHLDRCVSASAAKHPTRTSCPSNPGTEAAIALAVWEGSNRERSAQKAVSGDFMALSIEP